MPADSRPMLHLVLLFGPDGRLLDDYFDRAVPWTDEAFGDVVQLTALGDPMDQGSNYKKMLPAKDLDRGELMETWQEEVRSRGGPDRAMRWMEYETTRRKGITRDDLPCLIVTADGTGDWNELIRIDRTLVSTDSGVSKFFECLRDIFAADLIRPRLWHERAADKESLCSLISELREELQTALLKESRHDPRKPRRQPPSAGWIPIQEAVSQYGRPQSTLQTWCAKQVIESKKDPDTGKRLLSVASLEEALRKKGFLSRAGSDPGLR